MLLNSELMELEEKYFNILSDLLGKSIGQIITQINSQKLLTGITTGGSANSIEHAVENIVEAMIAHSLYWNVCSMPVSADSCFECGDAIIHIDAKTIGENDPDATRNKVTVQQSQTSYTKTNPLLVVSKKTWEPKLERYEQHTLFGEIPNLTYIIKVIYTTANDVKKIKLISLPNGQLDRMFAYGSILGAGRSNKGGTRESIRFLEDKIASVQAWRVKEIYERR